MAVLVGMHPARKTVSDNKQFISVICFPLRLSYGVNAKNTARKWKLSKIHNLMFVRVNQTQITMADKI